MLSNTPLLYAQIGRSDNSLCKLQNNAEHIFEKKRKLPPPKAEDSERETRENRRSETVGHWLKCQVPAGNKTWGFTRWVTLCTKWSFWNNSSHFRRLALDFLVHQFGTEAVLPRQSCVTDLPSTAPSSQAVAPSWTNTLLNETPWQPPPALWQEIQPMTLFMKSHSEVFLPLKQTFFFFASLRFRLLDFSKSIKTSLMQSRL